MCIFREAIHRHRDGATLDLFVTPRTSHIVFPVGYNRWRKRVEIKIISEAKENKANKEVINRVAKCFNKSAEDVSIVSGMKSREKTLLIKNVSADDVVKSLKRCFNGL